MPRISYVDLDGIDDPEILDILERARRLGTPRPESQAIRAHHAEALKAFDHAWETLFRGGIVDHTVKELCRLYISKSVDCAYCGGQRSVGATAAGMTEDKVDEILDFERSERFDDREKTALAWTLAIAWDPELADDALWERLHAHFSEAELVELGSFVALTLGQQRFLKTLALEHREVLADTVAGLAPADHPSG